MRDQEIADRSTKTNLAASRQKRLVRWQLAILADQRDIGQCCELRSAVGAQVRQGGFDYLLFVGAPRAVTDQAPPTSDKREHVTILHCGHARMRGDGT